MARRLFPDGYQVEERRKADHKVPRGVDLLRGTVPGVAKLVASPIVIGAEMKRERPPWGPDPRRLQLAQAGFGQSVSATAVSMTTAYASVAAGKIVRPRLVGAGAPRDDRLDKLEGEDIFEPRGDRELREKLLDQLRRGLNGVVTVSTMETVISNGNRVAIGFTVAQRAQNLGRSRLNCVRASSQKPAPRSCTKPKSSIRAGGRLARPPARTKRGAPHAFGCEAANVTVTARRRADRWWRNFWKSWIGDDRRIRGCRAPLRREFGRWVRSWRRRFAGPARALELLSRLVLMVAILAAVGWWWEALVGVAARSDSKFGLAQLEVELPRQTVITLGRDELLQPPGTNSASLRHVQFQRDEEGRVFIANVAQDRKLELDSTLPATSDDADRLAIPRGDKARAPTSAPRIWNSAMSRRPVSTDNSRRR